MVSALAATVGVLWRQGESRNAAAISKLEAKVDALELKQDEAEAAILECEKDRSQLRGECGFLRQRIETLEKRVGTRNA